MFSTDFHQSLIYSFAKATFEFTIKGDSSQKNFLEVTKGIERLQQNALNKLCFSDSNSEQVQFLLKLKTTATLFEHYIFHNNLKENVYAQVYSYKYCRLLPKQGSITDFFVGIISPPKVSRNCSWWSQDYSLRSGALKWLCRKLWKIIGKTCVVEFPFNTVSRTQPSAYCRTALQTHAGSVQKGKDVLEFCKFQKNICGTVLFSLTLQPCSPEFLTSANTDSKKMFS